MPPLTRRIFRHVHRSECHPRAECCGTSACFRQQRRDPLKRHKSRESLHGWWEVSRRGLELYNNYGLRRGLYHVRCHPHFSTFNGVLIYTAGEARSRTNLLECSGLS